MVKRERLIDKLSVMRDGKVQVQHAGSALLVGVGPARFLLDTR